MTKGNLLKGARPGEMNSRHIAVVGAGPAGLYFALLAKKADPSRKIEVFERNAPDDSFGWGIVFSDQALENLSIADADTHRAIDAAFHHWDNVEIHYRGEQIRSTGHGFSGIARSDLLVILRQRALALGVMIHDGQRIEASHDWAGYDLVVGADGVHSAVRERHREHFRPQIEAGHNRFIWLATAHTLNAFTFDFRETEWGWFVFHGYRFSASGSTVIIETSEENWHRAGLDRCSTAETIIFCERLFADCLNNSVLIANTRHRSTSQWVRFERLHCELWHHDKFVLLGDAAHTAHFSIGSGTRLAMEDAMALASCLDEEAAICEALTRYQTEREPEALKIVHAARNRQHWFENMARYTGFEPLQFVYSLFTGSQRISHSNLRLRDPEFTAAIETRIAARSGLTVRPAPPPMFTPFRLRDLTLQNRVVVSPMAMYSCIDGVPGDFHLAHLGELALGGAGLVMSEATYASPEGRITSACSGLWNDAQQTAWQRIADFVHANSSAKIGIQLGHAGPKGATPIPGQTAVNASWPLVAASVQPYDKFSAVPRAMTREDMDQVRDELVNAVRRAASIGFDLLELHCAHGYLLSSFLSPLTNHRNDEYGGRGETAVENRLRYPLEIFAAMRAVWPQHKPMFVRISAHDWVPGGNTGDDAVLIAAAFKKAGADLIDVSSGQTTSQAKPVYGRMYQTPFADRIRNETGIATMAVGNIFEHDHVNSIIAAGRADLCAIARPHLADPHWTLRAAAAQGYHDLHWPPPYERAKAQLESQLGSKERK